MSIASVSHNQVFGVKQDIKDNLFSVDDDTLIYPAGANVVINQKSHKRFVSIAEKSESISSLTVSPDRHLLAIAERGQNKPSINVFDIATIRKRRTLVSSHNSSVDISQSGPKEFTSLAFSSDSKYLAAQMGAPDWVLHYFAWDKGKQIATIEVCPNNTNNTTNANNNKSIIGGGGVNVVSTDQQPKVLQCSVNPNDGTVIFVLGDTFMKMYRYSEGELKEFKMVVPNFRFRSHDWLSSDRLAVGTEQGRILIIYQGEVLQFIDVLCTPDSLQPNINSQLLPTVPMTSIESIVSIRNGFIAGTKGGNIGIYDTIKEETVESEKFSFRKKLPVPDCYLRTMAVSSTEGNLLVELDSNQIFRIPLLLNSEEGFDEISYEAVSEAYHHGVILGLDICCRKPLLVTCSSDKSIRLWNYITGVCELTKYYPEEAFSVAFHPSGLYLLVGFSDKLRLMNVLIDDFRFFKEFSLRGCKECLFSNGGQVFAAVHGNMIQIYNTWTFENIATLKGHNGKVKSLHWSPDDSVLVSSGSDGAVYMWNVRDLKRENEYILKSCAFTSAVCTASGKTVYAVGSDRTVKEITESQITCEFDGNVVATQIALSHSGKMLFIGTQNGTIRSIKFPITSESDNYQEHYAHSGPITKLKISYDDQYLFSSSEDGCIYSFRISEKEERGIKRERTLLFADEILITKSDLEEKNVVMNEMQRTLDELKLEHEYQLRLKDMSFTEKLKEITETYSQEIEGLKILTSVLRTEKDKEEVKHEEEILHNKAVHGQELHDIESKYNTQLMEEYDKFQDAQSMMSVYQDEWLKQVKEFELSTQKSLAESQNEFENKLKVKSQEISRLKEEMRQDSNEFAEVIKQTEEDIDTEIQNLIAKYEKKLRVEKDEGARLKGENGIMRKKFNTLNKDIEDNRAEIYKMKEDEKKLQQVIGTLEREINGLKKEMSERDELIQDKERRVYDLKKKNQELEKFKFVLDHNIKFLKQQVEPREQHIAEMTAHISNINNDLVSLNKDEKCNETKIEKYTFKLEKTKKDYIKQHQKVLDLNHYLKGFRTDFQDLMVYIQEPNMLKKATENLCKKYTPNPAKYKNTMIDPDVESEHIRQSQILRSKIQQLSGIADTEVFAFKGDDIHRMADNFKLIHEINELRTIVKYKPPKKSGNGNGIGGQQGLFGGNSDEVKNGHHNNNNNNNHNRSMSETPGVDKLPPLKANSSPLPAIPNFRAAQAVKFA